MIPFGRPGSPRRPSVPPSLPRAARGREPPAGQGRWRREGALCGAHLPEEDAAGAHPAPARHLHRLRGAGHPGKAGGDTRGEGEIVAEPPELLGAGEELLTSVYKARNICFTN